MQMILTVFSTTAVHFLAAVVPMLTWSSFPAEVGIESTVAGKDWVLFSLAKLAADHEAAVETFVFNEECRSLAENRVYKLLNPAL